MENALQGFERLLALLPERLQAYAALPERECRLVEELRLRTGREPTVLLPEGERPLCPGLRVERRDLVCVTQKATGSSLHSAAEAMKHGFITARGGVRIGLCGTAVTDGGVAAIRELSSLCIRLPRQRPMAGAAEAALLAGEKTSVLIISPPGGGKTTFLRELVRRVSDGGTRVALADERGELAAVWEGEPQLDVGRCTDVITGAPKAEAALMLLRAMNPQVIAMDEITAPGDLRAIESVSRCGVRIFATVHAESPMELRARPLYRGLLEQGIFERLVQISRAGGERRYRLMEP